MLLVQVCHISLSLFTTDTLPIFLVKNSEIQIAHSLFVQTLLAKLTHWAKLVTN